MKSVDNEILLREIVAGSLSASIDDFELSADDISKLNEIDKDFEEEDKQKEQALKKLKEKNEQTVRRVKEILSEARIEERVVPFIDHYSNHRTPILVVNRALFV